MTLIFKDIMWQSILILGGLFSMAISNFDLLYLDTIPKTMYQNNIKSIVKVSFPFTDNMKNTSSKIANIYGDLVRPYNMSSNSFQSRSNPIYIQMDDLFNWLTKFYIYYDKFKLSADNYPPFSPTQYDKEQIITIDANYQKQKFDNMKLFANMMTDIYSNYTTLSELINNKDDLTLAITTLELLVQDFKDYVGTFYGTYQAMNLGKQGIISELLAEQLLKNKTLIDLEETKIIQGGKFDNTVTFIIQVIQKSAPVTYFDYIPISYFGYSLERDFYKLENSQNIRKFYLDDNLDSEEISIIQKCLNGLNQNDMKMIFEYCKFIKADQPYEVVGKGIIFNNGSVESINQINKMFHKNLKDTDFPVIIHYNGSLTVKDKAHKEININKKYPNIFQKSNLNSSMLSHLKETLFESHNNKIITLLQEEFTGVLISIISFIILGISFYLSQALYRKMKSNKMTQKPNEKLILKKLRASKRY